MNKEIEIPEGYEARIEGNKVILECKMSEDERIRKELMNFVAKVKDIANSGRDSWAVRKEDIEMCERFLAYLEKQKEQKPAISNEAIREGVAHFGITQYQIDNWLKKHINVVEQKPEGIDEYEIIKKHITEDSLSSEVNKRLKECGWYVTYENPVEWSEEDELMRKRCIADFGYLTEYEPQYKERYDAQIDWLKSLPKRFNLQPKQEWSEEDEKMFERLKEILKIADSDLNKKLNGIVIPIGESEFNYFRMGIAHCLSWLELRFKSLRPQSHWKPSEEQVNALRFAAYENGNSILSPCSIKNKELASLYEQLKKL